MSRPLLACSALCLLAASTAARAELSYSYLEGSLGVSSTDTSVGEQDGTGLDLRFSYDVLSYLHVFATAKYSEFDDLPVDSTLVALGAGVHYSHSDRTSIFFNLGALTTEVDVSAGGPSLSVDDDGYTYSLGFREANQTGKLEFEISAEHIELSDSDTGDTWVNLRLIFRATPKFRIATGVQFAGDDNAFKVGVRYHLPSRLAKR